MSGTGADEVIIFSDDEGALPSTEPGLCLKICALATGGVAALSMFIDAAIYFLIFGLSNLKSIGVCRWTAFAFGAGALLLGLAGLFLPKVGRAASWLEKATDNVFSGYALAFSVFCSIFFGLSFVVRTAVWWATLMCGTSYFALMLLSCGSARCRCRCCRCGCVIAVWGWHIDDRDTHPPT